MLMMLFERFKLMAVLLEVFGSELPIMQDVQLPVVDHSTHSDGLMDTQLETVDSNGELESRTT